MTDPDSAAAIDIAETPADAPNVAVRRSFVGGALKAAVSLGLLWVLLSRVDLARLWQTARTASPGWLGAALLVYGAVLLVCAWRWGLLLRAQHVAVPFRSLAASFLVATFFNNFLPSNIGGDVVRIADTARPAGSKTLAATVVLFDRAIGVVGLGLVAALGASINTLLIGPGKEPVDASVLWAGLGLVTALSAPAIVAPGRVLRLAAPLRLLHPSWVDERLARLEDALTRFRGAPRALAACLAGAVSIQLLLVLFYVLIARGLGIPVLASQLAVIVPISFVVQMAPVSLNGLGVREAAFGFCFTRVGLPLESALVMSFAGAALMLVASLVGGLIHLVRRR